MNEANFKAFNASPGVLGEQISGFHLLVDASGCDPVRMGHRDNLREFVVVLDECIGVPPHGEPLIGRFPARGGAGDRWSLMRLSKFASVNGHFFEDGAVACIDIFSTRPIDAESVRGVIERYFLPESVRVTCVGRGFSDGASHAETS